MLNIIIIKTIKPNKVSPAPELQRFYLWHYFIGLQPICDSIAYCGIIITFYYAYNIVVLPRPTWGGCFGEPLVGLWTTFMVFLSKSVWICFEFFWHLEVKSNVIFPNWDFGWVFQSCRICFKHWFHDVGWLSFTIKHFFCYIQVFLPPWAKWLDWLEQCVPSGGSLPLELQILVYSVNFLRTW